MSRQDAHVAIIGMACRFPGARNLDEFWSLLRAGREGITHFSEDELRAAGVPQAALDDPRYVRAYGWLEGMDEFDAAFFGYTPREAALIDPQQRVFLEICWHALEHAGYNPDRLDCPVGVFAGAGQNAYRLRNLASNLEILEEAGGIQTTIANDADFLATRVAYKLNLQGPALSVQTACSTSLTAAHLAVQSLLAGECDLALAGGVSIVTTGKEGYQYLEGGTNSPDGHTRAFDAAAQGMVGGDGAGVVVLKRLEEAQADGDMVYAVIRGSAINNDGSDKVGYTAPGVGGQARVIVEAQGIAGVKPDEISCIEAHGTATALGDAVEVQALTQAFRLGTTRAGYCAIGSVKTNIGHLNTAAGAAGLIKTALALHYREIPPSLHFGTPNPALDLDASPFYVNAELRAWEADAPRLAGVSSFGMGGTNAHLILAEAPQAAPAPADDLPQLLPISHREAAGAAGYAARLAEYLERRPSIPLADAAYTLQTGRRAQPHRAFVVADSPAAAASALRGARPAGHGVSPAAPRPLAFLFPGQGSQYPLMGRAQFERAPVFREVMERGAAILSSILGRDFLSIIYPPAADEAAAAALARTEYAQPAIFLVSYALAKLLETHGIRPAALLGHSIGEYTAAALAGVFTFENALALVAARGRLMGSLPPGGMLAIPLGEAETRALLPPALDFAVHNAPDACVVSGAGADLEAFAARLQAQGIAARRLHVSHAFHSATMDAILPEFEQTVAAAPRRAPQIPFLSNLTGTWITPEEAVSPAYWARQLRGTVRFAEGLDAAAGFDLLECGPGSTLSALARRAAFVVPAMRRPRQGQPDQRAWLEALGALWARGHTIQWDALHAGRKPRRMGLPGYPFARTRHWIEPGAPARPDSPLEKRAAPADWFYTPGWKRTPNRELRFPGGARPWLVCASPGGAGEGLARRLETLGQTVITAQPESAADFDRLAHSLPADLGYAVYAWAMPDEERAFHLPVRLARALGARAAPLTFTALTANLYNVLGGERVQPMQALALGVVKVAPFEFPQMTTLNIDLDGGELAADAVIAEILGAASLPQTERIIAFRRGFRWAQTFEPLPLPPADAVRPGGVTLITGGLGGVGLALGEMLGRAGGRLALVGRAPLPPRPQWDDWLAIHPADDPASAKIIGVRAIEQAGGTVRTFAADVSDRAALSAVIHAVEQEFGAISGVIHAAGAAGGGMMLRRSRADFDAVLAPKVRGTLALWELLGGRELDFFVMCSSLASTLGGFGQADYTAANAFLDAFAGAGAGVTSIAWETWQEAGMAVRTPVPEALRRQREDSLRRGLTNEEGRQAFARARRAGGQVLVSTQDFPRRYAQNASAPAVEPPADTPAAAPYQPARSVSAPFVAPRTPTESRVAAVWQRLLGIESIGVHDDFFELGGHSLLAMQLMNKLRAEFGAAHLSLSQLFDAPTIAGVSAALGAPAPPMTQPDDLQAWLGRTLAGTTFPNGEDWHAGLIWQVREAFDLVIHPQELRGLTDAAALAAYLARLRHPSPPAGQRAPLSAAAPRGYAPPAKGAPPNPSAIFILSAPRSGSTLLRLMLAGHSRLFAPPELALLAFDDLSAWMESQRAAFTFTGFEHALAHLRGIRMEEARRAADELAAGGSPQSLYRALQAEAAPRTLVDKTPGYARSVPLLRRAEAWFEEPKYIHLVRHPAAAIDSFARQRLHVVLGEPEAEPYGYGEMVWREWNRNILAFLGEVPAARQHRLVYERLVRAPETALREVCAFLSVPFEAAVLEPYAGGRMLAAPGDPDIARHERIEPGLAAAWEAIELPVMPAAETCALAGTLGYNWKMPPE